MARVTVEDCVREVENRFELVALAAQRARDINSGAYVTVEKENDKCPVIALREIAAGHVKIPSLKNELLERLQSKTKVDQLQEDVTGTEEKELPEGFDYIPEGADLYIGEDHSDLGEDHFEDEDLDEGEDLFK